MLNYKEWNDYQRLAVKVRIFFRLPSVFSLTAAHLKGSPHYLIRIYYRNKEPLKISMLKIHSPDGSGAQLVSVMHRLESYQNLNFSRIYSQKYLTMQLTNNNNFLISKDLIDESKKKRKIYHKFTRISCFNVVNVFINIQPFKISRRKNIN